jgi:hypothetical protein
MKAENLKQKSFDLCVKLLFVLGTAAVLRLDQIPITALLGH